MSLSIVNELRAALQAEQETEVPQPVEEWYMETPSHKNHVTYNSIAYQADNEYEKWLTLDPRIEFNATMRQKLREWMMTAPEEVLVARLGEPLAGIDADESNPAFNLTKFQRLSLATWIEIPFNIEATARVNVEALHAMAAYGPDAHKRQVPMNSFFAMLKGSCPDTTIVDFPTAGGKTAWSVLAALLRLSSTRFRELVETFNSKRTGTIFQGTCELKIARMCIIASAGSTFGHFKDTVARAFSQANRKYPDHTFVLWHQMSKNYSIEEAYRLSSMPNTILFWCVPVKEINKVLRQSPDIAIAVVITDEYTIDTPREQSSTTKSVVCHNLITQATPQALVRATCGNRSWLKDVFEGRLTAPKDVSKLIHRRQWTDVQLALNQACKLNLMTLTTYRDLIRDDLRPLVPNGMDIHMIRSRFLTLSALIQNSQVDLIPADFSKVLLNYLRGMFLTDDSIRKINDISEGYLSLDELTTIIGSLESRHDNTTAVLYPPLQRLKARISELDNQCPLCWENEGNGTRGVKIFGCCGYCVCTDCFMTVTKCPFCRAPIPLSFQRATLPKAAVNTIYPRRPDFSLGTTMEEDIARLTEPGKEQMHNVIMSLHILYKHEFNRVVMIVEKLPASYSNVPSLDVYMNPQRMTNATGFQVVRVDTTLSGKGSHFAKIKRRFDDLTQPPQLLLCYGVDPAFLVGTDLGKASAVVSVGNIGHHLLTQATGRTFRPVIGRDPSKPIKIIKVYSGAHTSLRRRPRAADE